jgi:hypothetical protein
MDGLKVKVKTSDGDEGLYPLRPKTLVAFEQKFNKGFAKLLTEDQKLDKDIMEMIQKRADVQNSAQVYRTK